ncbi:hypothetical protein CROQUDRAFT_668612 [Cronartium quercuum f. sp. fusiforme G11]|uniref:Superoxide dismutase n=1 Tax=Cronartium quercuum f. sp. fusiforme G11 TaxID=708437 RepID=A0A9P6TFD4_9BASI|nr:hypothetical protein CROQUDRAFT_668612 [Cronartium quercuum f. sp. fusiforme G11]
MILWKSGSVQARPIPESPSVFQYTLPSLPYDYSALEPAISGESMQIHHQKHHGRYVEVLNIAVKEYAEAAAANDLTKQISLQAKIKFNGGGHINKNLKPVSLGGGKLTDSTFGQAAFCQENRRLVITTTSNQDPLTAPLIPIHAYYLMYKQDKSSYLTNIWTVIDFDEANYRFNAAST